MTCSPRSWQHLLSVFPEGVIRLDLFTSPPLRCLCLPSLCPWGQNHGRDGPGPGPGPGGKGWEEVGNWGGRPGRRKPGDGDVTGSWQNPEGLGFPGMARGGLLGKRRLLAMTAIQQAREMAASRDLGGVGKHAVGGGPARPTEGPGSQPPRVHMALLPGIPWPQSVLAQRKLQGWLLVPRCGSVRLPAVLLPCYPGLASEFTGAQGSAFPVASRDTLS